MAPLVAPIGARNELDLQNQCQISMKMLNVLETAGDFEIHQTFLTISLLST